MHKFQIKVTRINHNDPIPLLLKHGNLWPHLVKCIVFLAVSSVIKPNHRTAKHDRTSIIFLFPQGLNRTRVKGYVNLPYFGQPPRWSAIRLERLESGSTSNPTSPKGQDWSTSKMRATCTRQEWLTVKPVLRDHCHERPSVSTDLAFSAEGPTF